MSRSVVLIHGLGLGTWLFDEHFTAQFLAAGYEVHNLSMPGHDAAVAQSDRQRITLDACVSFVENYLNQNIKTPFVLIGLSMGGAIIQKLLAKGYRHSLLRGIVLLCSVPPSNNLLFTLRLCNRLAIQHPTILVDFFAQRANPELVFSPQSIHGLGLEKINHYLARVLTGFTQLELEVFFSNLLTTRNAIDLPIKIIGGEDDMLFDPDVVRFTAGYYGQRAEILPGLGHMIPVEPNQERAFNAIHAFIKGIF